MGATQSVYDDVRDVLIDELDNYEECAFYGCDLGYELLSRYSADGTFFYNRQEAWDYIHDHQWDYGEIEKAISDDFGDPCTLTQDNMFNNPEAWHVSRMTYVARAIIDPILTEMEWWDEQKTLNKPLIKKIQEKIEETRGDSNIF